MNATLQPPRRRSLLEAISKTSRELRALDFFPVGYAWEDPQLGELSAHTVVPACDGETALAHLKSKHPHITRVWLIHPEPEPEHPFVTARSFLKREFLATEPMIGTRHRWTQIRKRIVGLLIAG